MPFVVRYPKLVKAGSINGDMVSNVDFAQTFLDLVGLSEATYMQGRLIKALLPDRMIEH